MSFRNQEQHDAFKKWWGDYVKQYFPKRAQTAGDDGDAMFIIKMAYSAGIRDMATRTQDALSFETSSTTPIKE